MTKRRIKRKGGRPRKSRSVSVAAPRQYGGDHGTGTAAATYNTELVGVTDGSGKNPNHMGQRRRINVLERLLRDGRLTMRQWQAGDAMARAYGRVQTLSSGGELKEQVQSSPKPDATIAVQCDAMSQLIHVMGPIRRMARRDQELIEAVCWHNLPLRAVSVRRSGDKLRIALDIVADHMRY